MAFTTDMGYSFWDQNMDVRVLMSYPFMRGPPYLVFTLVIINFCLFLFLKFRTSSGKEFLNHDLRPVQLIINGFLCGIHGAALPLVLALTRMGSDCLSCKTPGIIPDQFHLMTEGDIRSEMTMKLICILLAIRSIFLFEGALVHVTIGKPMSWLKVGHDSLLLVLVYFAFKFIPFGPVLLFGLGHVVINCVRYAHCVLSMGDFPRDHKTIGLPCLLSICYYLYSLCMILNSAYIFYNEECASSYPLLLVAYAQVIYAIGVVIVTWIKSDKYCSFSSW